MVKGKNRVAASFNGFKYISCFIIFFVVFSLWIKSGFRYGLSYLVVSVICAVFIVIGNDLLSHSAYKGNLCDTILQLGYSQWLPVCALALAFSCLVYLLFARIWFRRLPLWLAALLCGILSVGIALLADILPLTLQYYGGYEFKNMFIFFVAGFAFVYFSELMR
jgi:hypothetical protein